MTPHLSPMRSGPVYSMFPLIVVQAIERFFWGRWFLSLIRQTALASNKPFSRCIPTTPTQHAPERPSAIPAKISEDAPTKRVACDQAVPIEIAEDAPTKRVAHEEILQLAMEGELDELLLDIEVRASQKAVRRGARAQLVHAAR